ncbi:MAG TPA: hypothetical protein VF585_02730 [Chthoniobacterales bacterium]|jgi:hypothetical protein
MSPLQKKISGLALFDGASFCVMGALTVICAIVWPDFTGGMVGVALLTLGGIELHGRTLLRLGLPRATGWLVASQLGLLAAILAYCWGNIEHPRELPLDQVSPQLLELLQTSPGFEGGLEETLQPLMRVAFSLFMLISIFYQGGMAMYYLRKTPLALQVPPPLPPA